MAPPQAKRQRSEKTPRPALRGRSHQSLPAGSDRWPHAGPADQGVLRLTGRESLCVWYGPEVHLERRLVNVGDTVRRWQALSSDTTSRSRQEGRNAGHSIFDASNQRALTEIPLIVAGTAIQAVGVEFGWRHGGGCSCRFCSRQTADEAA